MWSEVSQRKANTVWSHLFAEFKKTDKTKIDQWIQRTNYREQTGGCWRGERVHEITEGN